jgi:hypothetical protein
MGTAVSDFLYSRVDASTANLRQRTAATTTRWTPLRTQPQHKTAAMHAHSTHHACMLDPTVRILWSCLQLLEASKHISNTIPPILSYITSIVGQEEEDPTGRSAVLIYN